MHDLADSELLAQYVLHQSEEAFATLVARHINLVHSVALRHVSDPHQAEDITQVVFLLLAKKAGNLSPGTILSGWLYRTARLTAANYLRTENRRQRREQEVHLQSFIPKSQPDVWAQIAPVLDLAMERLGDRERNAVVLRFFEGKSLKEVGAALGASEKTTQKSVERALKKLRDFFNRRGINLSAAMLPDLLSHSVQTAPTGLSQSITSIAISKGAALSGSSLLLLKSTLKAMTWLKIKAVAAATFSAVLIAGTATVALTQIEKGIAGSSVPSTTTLPDNDSQPTLQMRIVILNKADSFDPIAAMQNDPEIPGDLDPDDTDTPPPQIESHDPNAYINRGRNYLSQGNYGKAIVDFSHAISLNPKADTAYFNRGRAYKLKQDYEQAIADYNQVILLNPKAVGAYVNRGQIYNLLGNYNQALTNFNQAIQLDARRKLAYISRSASYLLKGDYDLAIADCNEAIQLDPQAVAAYVNRGQAYKLKGDYDQAIASYDQALQIAPKKFRAYNNRGVVHGLKGDYAKAIADYQSALEINPDFSPAYNNLAWLLATCPKAHLRDGKKAVENALQACGLSHWNNLNQMDTLAAAYAEAGDFKNAVTMENKVLATPGLYPGDIAAARNRLALYRAHKAYHHE